MITELLHPNALATLDLPVLAAFGTWDWIVVVAYFALVTWIGVAMSRKTPDATDYFLGGRSLPTWAVAVSLVATMLSAATFVGVPDVAFGGDLTYLIMNVGGFIAVFVVAFLFVPKLYHAGTVTIYGFIAQRFGEPARLAVSCMFIFGRMLASGARLFVAATPLCLLMFGAQAPLAWQMILAICLIGAVGTLYTTLGGVRAVVWVDALQLAIVIGTALLTIAILLHRIPLSPAQIVDLLANTNVPSTGGGKLRLVDMSLDPTRTFTLWTALFAAVFLNTASFGVDHDLAQRFLITKSVTSGGLSVIASQFLSVIVVSLFMCIGMLLFIFYKRPDVVHVVHEVPANGISIYPWFLLNELPPVVAGLSMAGFFAIAQGSLDSAMNALASSIVADIYIPLRRRRGHPDSSENAKASKPAVAMVGAVLCGFAIVCALVFDPKSKTLLDFSLGVMTFALSGMLGVFMTALLTRRGNVVSVIAALLVAIIAVTLVQDRILGWWSLKLFGTTWKLAWPWWMTLGSLLSFGVCVAGRPRPATSQAKDPHDAPRN